jgi:hypothetical protein
MQNDWAYLLQTEDLLWTLGANKSTTFRTNKSGLWTNQTTHILRPTDYHFLVKPSAKLRSNQPTYLGWDQSNLDAANKWICEQLNLEASKQ